MLVQDYLESVQAAASATPEQLADSTEAQHFFNLFYAVDRHLAAVIPEYPENDRRQLAAEIAPTCNGEGVAAACRKWANAYLRQSVIVPFEAEKLGEKYARNDVGNAERFTKTYLDSFKFLDDRKTWMKWDGKRWRDATDGELTRAATRIAKTMLDEAIRTESKDDHAWALATLTRKGLNNMIACAAHAKPFSSVMKQYDQHPELITVNNGILDLETGRLYPHSRDEMLTTLTKINYEPSATCPRWDLFLREVFNDDEELIAFVQRAVGYSMTAFTREHAFFILHGGGRNGKGTFIKILRELLGDAHRTTGFATFTAGRFADGERNTPALARLVGARLVTAGEPDQGVRLSESVIKSLTGEDEIEACQKYESPFTYIPAFKIWLHTNHRPEIRGTDEGIWSRPRMIPFNVTFKTLEELNGEKVAIRKDPDRKLEQKLRAERSGILNWAVRGAMLWFKLGLGTSQTVRRTTGGWREESDRVGSFIIDCFRIDENGFVSNDKLFETYDAWCKRNLVEHRLEGQTLSKILVERNFARHRFNGMRGFKGLTLMPQGGAMFQSPPSTGSPPPTGGNATSGG